VNGSQRRRRLAILAAVVLGLAASSSARAAPTSETPEFTVAPDLGIVGDFFGFGAQFNQHVYAQISGPPPGLPALESEVLALQPQFVRIFFNTTEWTNADRMASFIRTVQLAQRAQATINITWQGSTFAFASGNMARFAGVLADLLQNEGIDSLWVTMFNEPNSTRLTLPQYEQVYRLLDGYLRDRGVRDRVHFMGGDLVGTTSPLGQSQTDWFTYMATHMSDLLDAWSVHVYWNFWEPEKIDRRLATEVRTIYAAIPAELRRPLYVTEFGVRGLPTVEGEAEVDPGLWPDGTPIEQTNAAAFQEAWFMIRAAELGFSGTSKWDLYAAKYDNGTQSYSAIGPGTDGWTTRPVYRLLQLLTLATEPTGGRIVDLVRNADAAPSQLVTAYISPAANVAVLGLDTRGGVAATTSHEPEAYSIGGLPPNTSFRLVVWNADGLGDDVAVGDLYSGPAGMVAFSIPMDGVFALTSAP
jgi:hypothetical protein